VVAYLNEQLLLAHLPVPAILQALTKLRITISKDKSVMQTTEDLTYLRLNINLTTHQLWPTLACLLHTWDFIATVPHSLFCYLLMLACGMAIFFSIVLRD
jgi:hypothetical protein